MRFLTSATLFLVLASVVCSHPFGQKLRTYSPNYNGNNTLCKRQMQIYQEGIENLATWALEMLDANVKVPSGLLMANVDQFGDYEQCLSVRSPETELFQGKYCLPEIELRVADNSSTVFHNLLQTAQANKLFRGNLTDPQFYLPATNIFLVGMCLPSGCNEQDAVDMMEENLKSALSGSPYEVDIILRNGLCRTDKPVDLSPEIILAIFILVFPLLVSLCCWAKESALRQKENSRISQVLLSMSMGQNWRMLWSRQTQPDPLGCTHGMRAFFLCLLYCAHKSASYTIVPLTNKLVGQVMNHKWTLVVRVFWNYVDGLIFLSAILTAFHAAQHLKSGKKLNILKMYLRRYIRFVIPLIIVAFCVTYLTPLINDGPLWMRYFQHLIHNCEGRMWTLATLTSSSFGFPNNCYDTSNHLTTDLLLYLLAPFLVIALWHSPSRSFNFIVLLGTLVSYYKYHIIQLHDAPPLSHNNLHRIELLKIANYLLFPAIMRVPTYVIGVCFGCYLQHIDCKVKLDKRLLWLGNILAAVAAFYCTAWHHDITEPDYIHKTEKTLVYALVHPYVWACVLGWFVFICATGQAEGLNKFCSHHIFVMCTRFTLAFNLVQLPVMGYWIAAVRSPIPFSMFALFNLHELLVCFFLAIYVTLIYIVPIAQFWTLINSGSKSDPSSSKVKKL